MPKKKLEFETEWFRVESENISHIRSYRGRPFYRFVMPSGVMILAQRKDGKILLVQQYRLSIEAYTLELPTGQIDENESPRKAAIRELYEETGHVCKKINFLGVGNPWMDRAKTKLYLFYGQGATTTKDFKSEEDIKVVPVSIKEFKKLAVSGKLQQLQSFAPIFLAKWKFGLQI